MNHYAMALAALLQQDAIRFARQTSRLVSALVRPTLWLVVFAAGFQNALGVSIQPPYATYVTYDLYILPGLLGMVLLFQGMQSSLALVFDREAGLLRLLLTAPLPRWFLLFAKLLSGALLGVVQALAFLLLAWLLGLPVTAAGAACALLPLLLGGLMVGAVGLLLSVHVRRMENFAGMMNFVIFPAFFFSTALFPLWRFSDSGAVWVAGVAAWNPFTAVVELLRFALAGQLLPAAAAAVAGVGAASFWAAVRGYDPQAGVLGRKRGAEA